MIEFDMSPNAIAEAVALLRAAVPADVGSMKLYHQYGTKKNPELLSGWEFDGTIKIVELTGWYQTRLIDDNRSPIGRAYTLVHSMHLAARRGTEYANSAEVAAAMEGTTLEPDSALLVMALPA